MPSLRRIRLTKLNEQLVCGICSGYFVEATTIIECLHTFCKTCIVIHLQTSNYCPVCDVLIHKTKPLQYLREDRTLQDIVYKLVPGLFHTEMTRRARFYREHPEAGGDRTEQSLKERRHFFHVDDQISLSLEFLPPAHAHAHALGLRPLRAPSLSLSHPPNQTQSEGEDDPEEVGEEGATKATSKKGQEKREAAEEEENKVKVSLRRYLQCPAAVQVRLLEKFIREKYRLPHEYRVDIVHGGDCLSPELTLLDVVYMYKWTEEEPLHLQYTVVAAPLPHRSKKLRPVKRKEEKSLSESSPKKAKVVVEGGERKADERPSSLDGEEKGDGSLNSSRDDGDGAMVIDESVSENGSHPEEVESAEAPEVEADEKAVAGTDSANKKLNSNSKLPVSPPFKNSSIESLKAMVNSSHYPGYALKCPTPSSNCLYDNVKNGGGDARSIGNIYIPKVPRDASEIPIGGEAHLETPTSVTRSDPRAAADSEKSPVKKRESSPSLKQQSLKLPPVLSSPRLSTEQKFLSEDPISKPCPAPPPPQVTANPASVSSAASTLFPSNPSTMSIFGSPPPIMNVGPASGCPQRPILAPNPRLISNSYRASMMAASKMNGMIGPARPGGMDPTKPRLGRPPNSSRILAAAAGRIGPQLIQPRGTVAVPRNGFQSCPSPKAVSRGRPKSSLLPGEKNRLIAPRAELFTPTTTAFSGHRLPSQNEIRTNSISDTVSMVNGHSSTQPNTVTSTTSAANSKPLPSQVRDSHSVIPPHKESGGRPGVPLASCASAPTAAKPPKVASPANSSPPSSKSQGFSGVKPIKSPGKSRTHGATSSSIHSIAQTLANKHLQQNPPTPSLHDYTSSALQHHLSSALGLQVPAVNPAAAFNFAAYMAEAQNMLLQSAAARLYGNLPLIQPQLSPALDAKQGESSPIDLSPTNKGSSSLPVSNDKSQKGPSPKASSSKAAEAAAPSSHNSIAPPTSEVTITKLPNVSESAAVSPSSRNSASSTKSSNTNTVSITKRPIPSGSHPQAGGKFGMARSPSNAAVRQIPNPSLLCHQSEVRNNAGVSKPVPPKRSPTITPSNNNNTMVRVDT